MAENKTINIKVDSTSATKNISNLNTEIKKTSETAKKTGSDLTEVSKITDGVAGGAITKFQGLTQTLGGVSKAFDTMKGAIIATGIGALVVVIGALITAFKSSAEGQDKWAKVMGAVGAITGKLIDTLAAFGEIIISIFENPKKAITDFAKLIKENIVNRFTGLLELIPQLGKAITQLFSGDFSGAAKTATDATAKVALGVENITDKINDATKATKEYIKELERQAVIGAKIAEDRNKAESLERDLIVKRAEADQKIADLREKAVQKDTFNLKERIAFLTEASAIENKISAQEIEAAKLKRDAKILENKQTRSNKEALIEEEQLKARVIQLDTARLQAQKTLTKGIQTLRAEANSDLKAKTDEANKLIEDAAKQRNENLLKEAGDFFARGKQSEIDAANEKLEQLKILNEGIVEINKNSDETITANKKAASDAQIAIAKAEAKAKMEALDAVSATLNAASDLLGKQTTAGKVLAIASATISTFSSAQKAYEATVGIPFVGPVLAPINAGLAIAAGLKNIQAITKVKTPGGGGGGAPSGSFGGGGAAQAPNFNVVGNSGVNQLAQTMSGQSEQAPIQAFVVAQNVTSAQSLNRNIVNNASLG